MSKKQNVTIGGYAEILSGHAVVSREKRTEGSFSYAVVVPAQLTPDGLVGELGILLRETPYTENQLLRRGDVLVKRLNPDGAVVILDEIPPTVLSTNLFAIRPKPGLDSNYLAFLLESTNLLNHIAQLSGTGTTIAAISGSQIAAAEIPLIPFEEQRNFGEFWRLAKRRKLLLKRYISANERLLRAMGENLRKKEKGSTNGNDH
ncbi:MAG: restriction endonuclease subunit S [Planctomycetia bacterium]|nr:restriction endonuclease subunit S [Planctomycetia bacterium]